MELIGMLFYIVFFTALTWISIMCSFSFLAIIGIIDLIPEKHRHKVKENLCVIIVLVSLLLIATL